MIIKVDTADKTNLKYLTGLGADILTFNITFEDITQAGLNSLQNEINKLSHFIEDIAICVNHDIYNKNDILNIF